MAKLTLEQALQTAKQHHQAGRLQQAEALYRQVLAHQPNHFDALHYLGLIAVQSGRNDLAADLMRQAIALNPDWPEAHTNLGNVLKMKGDLDAALAEHRRAIALRPDFAEAHFNLGNILRDKGEADEAIAAFRQAIALKNGFAEAYGNLGNALKDQGRLDESIAAHRQAIDLHPNLPENHYNLGLALLARGDLSQGWDEYEWRWKRKNAAPARRDFSQPQWEGQPLAQKTLLVHAEQGFGDTIQFIRYLPLVAERCEKVVVECQPEVGRLIQSMAGEFPVVAKDQALPAFDFHCPLLSLPRIFAMTLENLPRKVPYLHANIAAASAWRERLAGNSRSLKVGLAWAGRKTHWNDHNRSASLSVFASLARVPGVSFYSLQKGGEAHQAKNPPAGLELIDWTESLTDFSDTAALIANLDLVISVDTAIVHLAGAMGKPVWILLPFAPDWRWMLDRPDSPWYPTMRLFRQSSIGDWEGVMRQVTEALAALVRSRS